MSAKILSIKLVNGLVKMSSLLYSCLLLSPAVSKTPWLQLHPSRAAHSQFYVGPQPAPTRLLPAFTPLPAATHPPPAPIIRTRTASFFSYYSEGSANFTNAIAVHRASITRFDASASASAAAPPPHSPVPRGTVRRPSTQRVGARRGARERRPAEAAALQ